MAHSLFIRRSLFCGAVGLAVGLPALLSNIPISAAPRKAQTRRLTDDPAQQSDGAKSEEKEVSNISLNYLKASWDKVLGDVAVATDTELVAERVPKKSFSRMDRKMHTREEALRILNNDLEKEGFRLRIMGKHLVMMEVRTSRREFSRETVTPRHVAASAGSQLPHLDENNGEAESSSPKASRNAETRGGRSVLHAAADRQGLPLRHIRQVNDSTAGDDLVAPPVPQSPRLKTVPLRARMANDIARLVMTAFESRAERIENGPNGLKAVRVYKEAIADVDDVDARTARFTIGVDAARNQLVVDASREELPGVLRLLRLLDVAPKTLDSTVKIMPGIKEPGRVAAVLQPELRQLMVASRESDAQASEDKLDDEKAGGRAPVGRPRQPARARPGERAADAAGAGAETAGGSAIPALKGEVVVESVPELGIIIIRGNERDAESVQALVKEIERLSAGSVPEVYLQTLTNIPSDSLAALLTAVYDKLTASRTGRPANSPQQQQGQTVSVLPILRPNAVVIIAPAADMESIKDLAQKFDLPGEAEGDFRVFRLKHAVASRVADSVTKMYPAAQAQAGANQPSLASLPPRVRILADMRTNSVIVQAEPRDMREVAAVIRKLDVDDAAAVSQMRIFPLKNAVAEELANTLQTAIQSILNPPRTTTGGGGGQFGGGGGAAAAGPTSTELREIKSTIIEFMDGDARSGNRVRSGVVADVRFTSDSRTNCLVVSAPPACMEMIEKMVERLDRSAQAVAEIKVFSLSNGDATAMVALLDRLFNQQGQQRGGTGGGAAGQSGQIAGGISIAGADDAGSTLIPLRFSVDVRTNSVIAIGGAEALRVVEAVLLRLDESDIRQRQNSVYRLKNSPATDVATAISQFLQTQRQAEQVDPGLISPFEQIEREVVVVAEPVSNSLLISATPRYFKEVMEIVTRLDEAPKQVVIQALLVEVTLDNTDEFGIELGIQDSILFDRSLVSASGITTISSTSTGISGVTTTSQNIVSQAAVPGFLFNSTDPLGNNTSPNINAARVGGQGLSNFNVGRLNGDLGYGGLVLSAGSESLNVLLRALAARRRVDVLSRPQIRTLDNQMGTIQVGQEIPRVNAIQTNQTSGNATPVVVPRSVGIILTVIPRISPDGLVVMELVARKDALNPVGVPLFTNANGSIITSPIIDTTNAQASVAVKNGQTIVLGGMITKSDDSSERKVPLLGDIPLIGQLFRYDLKKMRRTELLIFLTPRLVANDAEADMLKEIETQRMHFLQEEAEAIHGPILGIPGEADCYLPVMDGVPPNIPGSILDSHGATPGVPPVGPSTGVGPVAPPVPGAPGSGGPVTPRSSPAPYRRDLPAVPLHFNDADVPTTIMPKQSSSPLMPPETNLPSAAAEERSENESVQRGERTRLPGRTQPSRSVIQASYSRLAPENSSSRPDYRPRAANSAAKSDEPFDF